MNIKQVRGTIYFLIIFLLLAQHPESNTVLISSGVIGNDYDILSSFLGITLAAAIFSVAFSLLFDQFNTGFHVMWPLVKFASVVLFWPTGALVVLFGDPVYILAKKYLNKLPSVATIKT